MSSKLHDFGNPAAVQIVMVNQIHVTAISFFFLKVIHTKLHRWNHQNPKQVKLLHKNQIPEKSYLIFCDNKIVFEFLKLVWILGIRAKTKSTPSGAMEET
jgi:hypothetical protein